MKAYLISALMSLSMPLFAQTQDSLTIQPDTMALLELNEVVVSARRPDAVVTPEKVSYSPSATISGSGGTLYDTLLSLPGVSLGNGGEISINGQKGVSVTVDGRKSILTGEALMMYLKSLPAVNVDRIEVISAPSAKSDASSAVTTLNLRMRRNHDAGFTLGVNGSLRGWKAKRGLGALSAGYSTRKSTLELTYTFIAARNPSWLITDRPYLGSDSRMVQNYDRRRRDRIHNTSASFTHNISDFWSAGVSVTGNWFARYELGQMETKVVPEGESVATRNNTDMHYRNIYGNSYIKHTFTDGNGDINLAFDYFNYHTDEVQRMTDTSASSVDGDMGGTVKGYVGTLDFKRTLADRWTLSAGMKSTYLLIDNGGRYDGSIPDDMAGVDNLSSTFGYHENVNAMYAECRADFSLFSLTAGLRGEQTNVKSRFSGNEAMEQTDYRRHYIDFFPNASISVRLGEYDGAMVSYARRINRPRYADLNPFVYIFDDITHVGGNINLKPSVSNTLQLVWSHDSWLRVMLSASLTDDAIAKCYREISDKVLYVSPENLPRNAQSSITVSAVNVKVLPWWHTSVNATVIYNNYKFGSSMEIPGNSRFTPVIDLKNQFSFSHGWSGEISGQWHGKMAYGQAIAGAAGSVYVGIKKSFMKGQGNISVFVRDLFNTNYSRTIIKLPGKEGSLTEREYEQMRQIGVSFGLRFKSGKVRSDKSRSKGLIDEIKRVNL
ncbi:MAG: TonB-dependent receptor [Muribaculaceae bacterium]|nr:TonB-dependent receptor [Muribaculaceae bacterium]